VFVLNKKNRKKKINDTKKPLKNFERLFSLVLKNIKKPKNLIKKVKKFKKKRKKSIVYHKKKRTKNEFRINGNKFNLKKFKEKKPENNEF
jgi:hypothetical protein